MLSLACLGDMHAWIRRGRNNNNAESYNHVLKSKIEWRTMKRMTDLIECVHTLVTVQMKDLRRSLHRTGNSRLAGPFVRHQVTYQVWQAMSDERKESAYKRFLSDSGSRQTTTSVESTDRRHAPRPELREGRP